MLREEGKKKERERFHNQNQITNEIAITIFNKLAAIFLLSTAVAEIVSLTIRTDNSINTIAQQ